MSRIVILCGSVRRGGNTETLARAFAEGAAEHSEVKLLSVADLAVKPCTGCNFCYTSEGNRCAQADGMEEVYDALRQADVLVIASPVYFYSVCAQMKTMIDRCLADYQAIKDKTFYLIVTAADPQHSAADETLADFRGYLRCLPGAREAGVILCTGTWDKGDVYRHPALKQAYELGRSI